MTIRHALCIAIGGAAILLTAGCYKAAEVNAFLMSPRAPVSGQEYRVYPPDVLVVSSLHVPEINGQTQQVRPDGKINLPLLGEIPVVDKTPKEIEAAITEAAKVYYAEADAVVNINQYNSQKFYIFGQVVRPGPMPWTGRDTLLDALCKAQPTDLAWPERIIVVRPSQPSVGGYSATQPAELKNYKKTGVHQEVDDRPRHKMTFNLMAMVKTGDLTNNVYLKPNDIIYVQPNPFAEIGLALQSILFPVRPVLEAVRVPSSPATRWTTRDTGRRRSSCTSGRTWSRWTR